MSITFARVPMATSWTAQFDYEADETPVTKSSASPSKEYISERCYRCFKTYYELLRSRRRPLSWESAFVSPLYDLRSYKVKLLSQNEEKEQNGVPENPKQIERHRSQSGNHLMRQCDVTYCARRLCRLSRETETPNKRGVLPRFVISVSRRPSLAK